MIVTVGVDPGKTGAAAILIDGKYFDCVDFGPDALLKLESWAAIGIDQVVLEKVHAMPGQGVTSMFNFGANYGWWIGVLETLRVPFTESPPQTWMKGLVPKKKSKSDKPGLPVARRLFPEAPLTRKKDNGRADALLMAYYLFLKIGGDK